MHIFFVVCWYNPEFEAKLRSFDDIQMKGYFQDRLLLRCALRLERNCRLLLLLVSERKIRRSHVTESSVADVTTAQRARECV